MHAVDQAGSIAEGVPGVTDDRGAEARGDEADDDSWDRREEKERTFGVGAHRCPHAHLMLLFQEEVQVQQCLGSQRPDQADRQDDPEIFVPDQLQALEEDTASITSRIISFSLIKTISFIMKVIEADDKEIKVKKRGARRKIGPRLPPGWYVNGRGNSVKKGANKAFGPKLPPGWYVNKNGISVKAGAFKAKREALRQGSKKVKIGNYKGRK